MAKIKKKELFVDGHGDVREVGLPDYEINWDKIAKNVREALEEHERQKLVKEAPYHPGYEGAVIKEPKKTKTKKTKAK